MDRTVASWFVALLCALERQLEAAKSAKSAAALIVSSYHLSSGRLSLRFPFLPSSFLSWTVDSDSDGEQTL